MRRKQFIIKIKDKIRNLLIINFLSSVLLLSFDGIILKIINSHQMFIKEDQRIKKILLS